MHVLVIPSTYPTPGNPYTGVFFREQATALRNRGVKVGVVFPDPRGLSGTNRRDMLGRPFRTEIVEDDGVVAYITTYPAVPKAARLRVWLWLRQVERLIDRYVADQGAPDLIHAHGLLWAGVGATRSALAQRVPTVITAHYSNFAEDLVSPRQEAALANALRRADRVVAVSRSLMQQLQAVAPGVQVDVVPNLVDAEKFALADRQERPEYRWLTVTVAITGNKALDVLLQAFARAFADNSTVRLVVVGGGRGERKLRDLASALGVSNRIEFLGQLDRTGVIEQMHAADAFALTSRVETFGVVLIEAMATGLPVVTTDSGGPGDVVDDRNGIIVPVDDVSRLAEAMAAVHADRQRWRAAGPSIRESVVTRFDESVVIGSIIQLYEETVSEWAATPKSKGPA